MWGESGGGNGTSCTLAFLFLMELTHETEHFNMEQEHVHERLHVIEILLVLIESVQ